MKRFYIWHREDDWCLEAWLGNAAEAPAMRNSYGTQQFIILFQFICLGVILGIFKYGEVAESKLSLADSRAVQAKTATSVPLQHLPFHLFPFA